MAEPTPGRPGQTGSAPAGARSATAATFQVNDKSLKDLHTTWRNLIKDVKEFNAELQALSRGGKTVDQLVAKLGQLGIGGGRGGGGTVTGVGGRMPGMPPVPGPLPQNVAHLGMPTMGAPPGHQDNMGSTTPPLAGGSSPWASRAKRAGEFAAVGVGATSLFYAKRMDDISDADLLFNQQAQNTGWGYRGSEKTATRNAIFGRPGGQGFGSGITGYQNTQDALGGTRNILSATGGTLGARGDVQRRQAGFLTAGSPDMGYTASGAAVGGLYDPTVSARMASVGMGPSVGMRGQLQTPFAIYQKIVQTVYRGKKPTAQMITEGLQPGANLYLSLTQGLGLTPDQIEQFSRYAIAQANLNGDVNRTNRAYEDAARGRITADTKRAGLTQNIRTSQNLAGAAGARRTIEAGREAEHALETGFRDLASATDRVTDAFSRLYSGTHGRSGDALGGIGLLGGPVQSAMNAIGGVGGGLFGYQAIRQMLGKGATGGPARGGSLGRFGGSIRGVAGAGEWGAPAAEGAAGAAAGTEMMAAAGPIGVAIGAAFVAHLGGEAMKGDAAGRKGLRGAVEDIVGQHLSSGWKILKPGKGQIDYAKDMYHSVKRHAGFLPFAQGGVIPGDHDRDDVDIKATPGEVVVPRGVVRSHGGPNSLMHKLGFRGRGANGHYADGGEVTGKTDGLNPSFLSKLRAWAHAEGENFNITSGYRSYARQQELYNGWIAHKPGYNLAAKPGESNHNFGLAADGPPWGNRHPERFGLRYSVEGENWHVEPFNAKAMRGGAPMASGSNTQGNVATPAQTDPASPSSPPNYVTAPRAATDEKSAYAAWLSRANTMYGVNETPSATASQSPKAGGVDATSPTASSGTAPSDPGGNAKLGMQRAAARGWTGSEWDALYNLFQKESGWRTDAANPSSSARGIAQTMMSVHFGKDWKTSKDALDFMRNPGRQIDWGLNYIAGRYTTPSKAWAHSQKLNWYDTGAWQTGNETAVLHKDEMVVPAVHARRMRALLSGQRNQTAMAYAPAAGPSMQRGTVSVSITMPVQLAGKATPDDARQLVQMLKRELQENDELANLGSG